MGENMARHRKKSTYSKHMSMMKHAKFRKMKFFWKECGNKEL
jgi:hypothetical protein